MRGDWHIKSIFHFTVNATNFERSLEFYTTIGFKVLRDNRDVIWPRMVAPPKDVVRSSVSVTASCTPAST